MFTILSCNDYIELRKSEFVLPVKVYASAGTKVSVHKISSEGGGGAELTHLLSEHTRFLYILFLGSVHSYLLILKNFSVFTFTF